MKKQIVIEIAVNGYSLIVMSENVMQVGFKVKTNRTYENFIANDKKQLHDVLDNILQLP